ncbi:cation/H(+) antiporter 24-like [Euphorbia lathyris]|uniref:cation/H(+) antiporter 24-like n=1 Tax=Euphorbia lathyris TaxID=212925 RepID=UPI0033132E79
MFRRRLIMVRFLPIHDSVAEQQPVYDPSSFQINHLNSKITTLCQKLDTPHSLGIFYRGNPLDYSFTIILLEIIFVILISRGLRFILKPLKQPRIVSDMIGGLMIGPSVLGRNKVFMKNIFPEKAQFIIRNVGIIGFMFFVFLSGVTIDLTLIRKLGKKHLYISLVGMFCPLLVVGAVGACLRSSMDSELAKASGIGAVAGNLAFTSYPVIYLILRELNLLSSEIGRLTLSVTIVSDTLGIVAMLVFETMKQGEVNGRSAFWYVLSTFVLGAFILIPVRRLMFWIVKETPDGKPVEQTFIVCILLGVLFMGFITDMFGLSIGNGSLWFGLVIPDGPPLGAAIVERSETIINEILMPFSFALIGLFTDVDSMVSYGWSRLGPLFYMLVVGYATKIFSTYLVAVYFKVPTKDSLTLSLTLNLRGQLELLMFLHWMDKLIIGPPGFTLLVLATIVMTGVSTPLISILYNPTRPYMVNKRRTVQHSAEGKEFCMVVCITNTESLGGTIELLEISHPAMSTRPSSPVTIYALHLVELVGRRTPALINHDDPDKPMKDPECEIINNSLRLYQDARKHFVRLHFYTAMTVKRTMYQDICKLALVNKAALIIVPFEKGSLNHGGGTEIVGHEGVQSLCTNVITHAPCSVGILVDKDYAHNKSMMTTMFRQLSKIQQFILLFLGGADAREALAYGDRMIANPNVSLIVVRFLAYNGEGDDEIERKLDDRMVTSFWMKNESNERVMYREIIVKNGKETLEGIHAFKDDSIDLWIVGREQGINPIILEGLSNWSEHLELGTIGDFVSSDDFGSNASVLVMHQQIMRG